MSYCPKIIIKKLLHALRGHMEISAKVNEPVGAAVPFPVDSDRQSDPMNSLLQTHCMLEENNKYNQNSSKWSEKP